LAIAYYKLGLLDKAEKSFHIAIITIDNLYTKTAPCYDFLKNDLKIKILMLTCILKSENGDHNKALDIGK